VSSLEDLTVLVDIHTPLLRSFKPLVVIQAHLIRSPNPIMLGNHKQLLGKD